MLVMAFFYAVVFSWMRRGTNRADLTLAYRFFLALIFLDVSTHLFLYVRHIDEGTLKLDSGWKANAVIHETPTADHVGIRESTSPHYYANRFLMYRSLYELAQAGFPAGNLPGAGLFAEARPAPSIPVEKERLGKQGLGTSLPLSLTPEEIPYFQAYLSKSGEPHGQIALESRTFNSWNFHVVTDRPVLLFLRDGYSPYWKAKVNGSTTPIARAWYHFKAVPLPAGMNRVELRFEPPHIALLLALGYLSLICAMAYAWVMHRNTYRVGNMAAEKSQVRPSLLPAEA